MTQQQQLDTYHNKIHNINIYSILKKRNIHISHNLRESLHTFITDLQNNNIHIKNIHTLQHNNFIDNEIKLLLAIFSQLIPYEINILDVILLFYTMDVHHLKNFIRFYNIQVIKDNTTNTKTNNNTNANNTNSTILPIDISESTNKIDLLHTLHIYSQKNIIHSLLIINFLKRYYFPNAFIHSS
jgi:hypothetical protein